MGIEFTRKGYVEVYRQTSSGWEKISQHTQEREATETIVNHSAVHGDGVYEIRSPVVVAKAYGVLSPSETGDTVPPSTPTNIVLVQATANTLEVSCDAATDNVGVAGYQWFLASAPIATTVAPTYTYTGLAPTSTYDVGVLAYDARGNNSGVATASFSTVTNNPPVWTWVDQTFTQGDAVNIDLDLFCTDPDGDSLTFTMVSGVLPDNLLVSGARNQTISGTVGGDGDYASVWEADDGFNAAVQVAITLTVQVLDTTAPDAPANPAISAKTSSTMTVSWDANAEPDLAYYSVYRSVDGSAYEKRTANGQQLVTSFQDVGLNGTTQYWYKVTATDDAGNESAYSAAVTDTTLANYWNTIPDQADTFPSSISNIRATYWHGSTASTTFSVEDNPVTGNDLVSSGVVSYNATTDVLSINADPTGTDSQGNPKSVFMRATISTAESDWLYRTGQSSGNPYANGVVWYHDFRTEDEVNNFRWTGGLGNDPSSLGSTSRNASWVRRITSDGITGGGCLEVFRAANSTPKEASSWWRPFSAISGGADTGGAGPFSGNGRGSDDPAANNTLTVHADWSPDSVTTAGKSMMQDWSRSFYGHPDFYASYPSKFDGWDYYIQVRVKVNQARDSSGAEGGKVFYFTRNDKSLTDQEIVTTIREVASGTSEPNIFNMYRSGSPNLRNDGVGTAIAGDQPGTEWGTVGDGICRLSDAGGQRANCWDWPYDDWCTLLYHVRNGHSSAGDTLVEVWAARPGETAYTQIWNQPDVNLPFDVVPGHNAIICSSYFNNLDLPVDISNRFDQIIFSTEFIPCPQV